MIWQACEQNSPTECLEISTIPSSVKDGDLESKVLNILEEIDIPVDPSLVKDCHRLSSQDSPKKIKVK